MTDDEKRLSALYQSMEKENSPDHLDARILAMAERGAAVHSVPLESKDTSRWSSWRWPLSSVVSAALLVGVLFFTTSPILPPEEQVLSAPPRYDVMPSAPQQERHEYQAMPEGKRQVAERLELDVAAEQAKESRVTSKALTRERLAEIDRLIADGKTKQAGDLLLILVEEIPEVKVRLSEAQQTLLQDALHRAANSQ
ncbi:hypothetical protein [Bowmanella pacifica]|uniref:Uncharacterized protein n=1 Tax=Bowmanella pacifica TaxID=502051 RepID=A0A917Z4Q4_9ALTE|nr:hypothetical protein [Bowmanella pacifica]GGO72799.1 hypothetical protein GCM10010982_31820 [Bowmanella pacifica]